MFSPQKQNSFLNGGIIEKLLTVEESAHFYPKSIIILQLLLLAVQITARNISCKKLTLACENNLKCCTAKIARS